MSVSSCSLPTVSAINTGHASTGSVICIYIDPICSTRFGYNICKGQIAYNIRLIQITSHVADMPQPLR